MRKVGKLTVMAINKLSSPGMHGDGGGLWLQVSPTGSKSWICRYQFQGKQRYMGLGPLGLVSLAEARRKAVEIRQLLFQGIDPLEQKAINIAAAKVERAKLITFKDCAAAYIAAHSPGWRNIKHAQQWQNTLATYAFPLFGDLPVSEVDTSLIIRCLEPIWSKKTETATRVRGRIESILDYATTRSFRQGENPARWKGHLENLLPKPSKVARVEHHAAMPFPAVPEFMGELKSQEGISARCLEFVILTAVRTGEAIGAKWQEIDMDGRVWTIPTDRMKASREHRVPLSSAALMVINKMNGVRLSEFIFPGMKHERKR